MADVEDAITAVLAEQVTGRGVHGVVCAAAPAAAAIGAEQLRRGGNAYDAAVAAALAETVLLPPKCGLAGDLVALTISPGSAAPEALIAVGGAPAALPAAVDSGQGLPTTGPLSVGVPGAPAGYAALAERATRRLADLARPARDLAAGGFPCAPILAALSRESTALLITQQPDGTVYLPGGRAPDVGQIVRLPGLARVLDEFVERGAALFHGPVGEDLVRRLAARGGVIDGADLRAASAEWCEPVSTTAALRTVWATPAPTQGPVLLEAVHSADAQPTATYRSVVAAISHMRNNLGDNALAGGGTSMVSAADAEGHAVCIVHSNSFPRFGSGIVLEGWDLILSNRAGRGFTTLPGHPNAPVAGRRPVTTLHAWAVAGPDGRPAVLGGTPGGDNQVVWNAQMLSDVLSGRTDLGGIVTAPRWELDVETGRVRAEAGLPEDVLGALRDQAPDVAATGRLGLRSAQQLIRTSTAGIVGATDPRTGGAALGV